MTPLTLVPQGERAGPEHIHTVSKCLICVVAMGLWADPQHFLDCLLAHSLFIHSLIFPGFQLRDVRTMQV
jgi:hypothetical protein